MEAQHKKLHAAVNALLNFRPSDDLNALSHYAQYHHGLGLPSEYFDSFRDAFLGTLQQLEIDSTGHALDAWRAIFNTAIPHITRKY